MGNSSTSCCSNQITGECPSQPSIQCTNAFLDGCDGVNSICTTFIQSDPGNTTQGTCSATQPCCIPTSTGNVQIDSDSAWLYDDTANSCPAQGVCGSVNYSRCFEVGGYDISFLQS